MLDAGAEAADGAGGFQAGQQFQHFGFADARLAGHVGIGGERVRQIGLDDAQDGAFGFAELVTHGRSPAGVEMTRPRPPDKAADTAGKTLCLIGGCAATV